MEQLFEAMELTLGQLYYLARYCLKFRYAALLELDRRIHEN
jgi:hypothetical protein